MFGWLLNVVSDKVNSDGLPDNRTVISIEMILVLIGIIVLLFLISFLSIKLTNKISNQKKDKNKK